MAQLPHYRGCLNLLQALYSLWWRDAQRDPEALRQLAEWTDQTISQARRNRPSRFQAACQNDLLED